jgi:hypothetical protein
LGWLMALAPLRVLLIQFPATLSSIKVWDLFIQWKNVGNKNTSSFLKLAKANKGTIRHNGEEKSVIT